MTLRDIRAALYMRVSTSNKDQTTESQHHALEAFCRTKGYGISEIYQDVGFSGAKCSRPQLDRLMADARQHKFDIVVVYRFDRFARSTRFLLEALEMFRKIDIGFVSVSESIDTSTPLGEAMFTIVGALAALERSTTIERIKSGLAATRAKGTRLGRPRMRDDRAIIKLRESGCSIRRIAYELGLSKGSVQAALKCSEDKRSDSESDHVVNLTNHFRVK